MPVPAKPGLPWQIKDFDMAPQRLTEGWLELCRGRKKRFSYCSINPSTSQALRASSPDRGASTSTSLRRQTPVYMTINRSSDMRSGGVYAATFWRRTRTDGAVDGAATHFRQKLLRLPDQLKLKAYVQTPACLPIHRSSARRSSGVHAAILCRRTRADGAVDGAATDARLLSGPDQA